MYLLKGYGITSVFFTYHAAQLRRRRREPCHRSRPSAIKGEDQGNLVNTPFIPPLRADLPKGKKEKKKYRMSCGILQREEPRLMHLASKFGDGKRRGTVLRGRQ